MHWTKLKALTSTLFVATMGCDGNGDAGSEPGPRAGASAAGASGAATSPGTGGAIQAANGGTPGVPGIPGGAPAGGVAATSGGTGPTPTGGTSATSGGTPTTAGGRPEMTGGASAGGAPSAGNSGGPPPGAYVACSNAAPPTLKLTTILEDLNRPIYATTPARDAKTMFVVMRGGELRRYDLSKTPPSYVSLVDVKSSVANECGFFSVALHPNFDGVSEKRIYLSYMPSCPSSIFAAGGSSTLDEYLVEGDKAIFSKTLLELDQPQGNHNGGLIQFGPDGFLYFGLGDGGGGNDNSTGHGSNGNGQDVATPLGKLLRFDVDDLSKPPAGNLKSADVGGGNVHPNIFHRGLRNPWRWSFDRLTGDLFIGDVGQDTCEEVDFLPAGAGPSNFGWSAREGTVACRGCGGHTVFPSGSAVVEPIFTYPTDKTKAITGGCGSPLAVGGATNGAIIGGYVYRGSRIPGLYGRYLFTDFERKTGNRAPIFALTADGKGGVCDFVADLIPSADLPSESVASFAEDADGELYVVNMTRGEILRIDPQ